MLIIDKLSYEFPEKELYNKISFTLEDNSHCAFIGTNGTGKSTLIDMIRNPEDYLFEGKLEMTLHGRTGYVSQIPQHDAAGEMTVFDYISQEFARLQNELTAVCTEMETAEDLEPLMERYQKLLDESQAIDADNYETNIKKQLKTANLGRLERQNLSKLSGGEYKLVQIMKEMLTSPSFIIMDEPDGYLDFEHLNALRDLINSYKGTMLVVTHNRYLLNYCFDKIIHLENTELQEFDGNYVEYNFARLQTKIELQERAAADTEEIERNKKIVDKLRNSATAITSAAKGRSLHARVSMLERLEAGRIKAPFVEIRQPEIRFHGGHMPEDATVLKLQDYEVSFDELLLEQVNFEIKSTDKVAIVGPNGAGKTTLLREIFQNNNKNIFVNEEIKTAFLSQCQGESLDESHTVTEEFMGQEDYLLAYGFTAEDFKKTIGVMSGGEKALLQLAKAAAGSADLLLLDEPTSHLDTYSQLAFEAAVSAYDGAVLMVSHDFYTIANTVDYVLLIDGKTVRKVSVRKFRKMIYANHFDKDYLENEQKKKDLEMKIAGALKTGDFESAKELSEKLGAVIKRL